MATLKGSKLSVDALYDLVEKHTTDFLKLDVSIEELEDLIAEERPKEIVVAEELIEEYEIKLIKDFLKQYPESPYWYTYDQLSFLTHGFNVLWETNLDPESSMEVRTSVYRDVKHALEVYTWPPYNKDLSRVGCAYRLFRKLRGIRGRRDKAKERAKLKRKYGELYKEVEQEQAEWEQDAQERRIHSLEPRKEIEAEKKEVEVQLHMHEIIKKGRAKEELATERRVAASLKKLRKSIRESRTPLPS